MSEERPFQSPWNFLGMPDDLSSPARAKAWVLPIPYEATTSYGANTRNGPAAIIAASRQVELFDYEFDDEPAMRYGVHTMNPMGLVHRGPEQMVEAIADLVAGILGGTPRPEVLVPLGGEHTISAGVARGLARVVNKDELVCVQVDAHADLRDEYEGSPFSHACAARRILDVCPVFQIGIRNISVSEEPFRRQCRRVHTVFAEEATAADGKFLHDLAGFVRGKQVFFTIDLDGLDPSIMPAVGTPEPGGLSWQRMLDICRVIAKEAAAVPVFDVVELAPIPGLIAPDFLTAKLIYKILTYILHRSAKPA
jgi:agmatinase